MTTAGRWIAVSIDFFSHPVVGMNVPPPKPADKSRHAQSPALAWLDLISSASWKAREVNHKGKRVKLERGQFLAGRSYWAERWNWGEQAVRSYFAKLCSENMIEICNQSCGHLANVASICKYEEYQGQHAAAKPVEKPEPNQSLTSAQPEGNQTVPSTTKVTNNTISCSDAREAKKIDLDELSDRLVAACNGALDSPANRLGMISMAVPQMWISEGADLEMDVIPTLKVAGVKYHGKRIRTWDYFTPMIADAKARRERGMPEGRVSASQAPAKSSGRFTATAMRAMLGEAAR